jgi:NAD-dependent SIR2 family protein deacetylase
MFDLHDQYDPFSLFFNVPTYQVQEMVETADLGLVMGTSLKVNPFKKWVDCVGIPMVSCGEKWRSGEVEKWRSGPVCEPVMRAWQIEYTF